MLLRGDTPLGAPGQWVKPEGCPVDLPLFFLTGGDMELTAKTLSLQQDIAADCTFSCAFLADFAWSTSYGYRKVHWEAGIIGHVLYLAAESIPGLRGTGMGAFFGALTKEVLELPQNRETVYHFAVGGPVEDKRLRTDPPYDHLKKLRGHEDKVPHTRGL